MANKSTITFFVRDIADEQCALGGAMKQLKPVQDCVQQSDDVLNADVILVWSDLAPRVITGADILGRLLKGIGQDQRKPV